MNFSSTIALTRELKQLEVPFLSTDDPWFLWLKYQISIYFQDCVKTIEVWLGLYEKSEKQKKFMWSQNYPEHKNHKNIVMEQAYKVFDFP